jgi:hypothetical protein
MTSLGMEHVLGFDFSVPILWYSFLWISTEFSTTTLKPLIHSYLIQKCQIHRHRQLQNMTSLGMEHFLGLDFLCQFYGILFCGFQQNLVQPH